MENYQSISQIGKGKFGSIFKILRKSDSKVMVWKELDYCQMSEKEKQQIVSEVNILRELKHPNIVRYYDRLIDKKNLKIYIIMEYCEGGDINQLIKRCKKASELIQEDVIWKILSQIISAIHTCHNRIEGKILHRDIKPSNIFLDNENNIKLGDFGLSRVLSSQSNFAYSHVGTPYYMSPEQIDEMRYNDKSDIWSLGCFLYELTTLNPPFEAKNHVSLAMKIKAGKVDKIHNRYSEELWKIIQLMLSVDHHLRPSIDELLNLPQILLRLREKKIKDSLGKLKKIEESLKLREEILNNKEKELNTREKTIKDKEEVLNKQEKVLNEDYNLKMKMIESVLMCPNAKYSNTNTHNGSLEDYETNDASNKYIEENSHYPNKVFKSIQNMDYYIPKANKSTTNSTSISYNNSNIDLNSKQKLINKVSTNQNNNSFQFDPNLYNDNDYPNTEGLSRYHSNNDIYIRNKCNSNQTLIGNYQSRRNNNREITTHKGISSKRPMTPKNTQLKYHQTSSNQKYTITNSNSFTKINSSTNPTTNTSTNRNNSMTKKRTNSVNTIIDNSNSMSSNYIKARLINIPKNK